MIGALIRERYLITSELGRGGMGIVYKATDNLLEREVAVKVVSASGLGTEGHARLLQEARAAAGLNHPNIVAVYDAGQTDLPDQSGSTSFIVMELLAGQALRDHRTESLEEVARIADQICAALTAAHSRGIVHGDLKPENVWLTPDGTVRLMDFGLARMIDSARFAGDEVVAGTLSYMAPELILGQPPSPQSDLYALGVTVYELATGRPVFENESVTGLLSQHLHASVVPPSAFDEHIPPLFDDLVVNLLRKRPEDRPGSAGEVREMLAGWHSAIPATLLDEFTYLDRLGRGRLVGRSREFGQSRALWSQAVSGRGKVLMVTGEPGIGKTRFVREITTLVEVSQGQVLSTACYAEEGLSYGPIARLVRRLIAREPERQFPAAVAGGLARLAPELRPPASEVGLNEVESPGTERESLFEGFLALADFLSVDAPLLIFIDDLHWADQGTLALLRHMGQRLTGRPIMLVLTYRESELLGSPGLQEMLAAFSPADHVARLKLGRLDRPATNALLETLLAGEVESGLVDAIYKETEGNPFFIEEVCKALLEAGQLRFSDNRWQQLYTGRLSIPQGALVAIQGRLGTLDRQDQILLKQAALIGRTFDTELLLCVSGGEIRQIERTLERAQRAQLIEAQHMPEERFGSGRAFTFAHALIQTAVLSDLDTFRRQRMQRRVALALEETYPERLDELAPMLGRYFGEAGEVEKAARYLLLAGDQSRSVYAYQDAADAYVKALVFLEELDDPSRTARTLMKLGLVYSNDYQFEMARQAFEQGFALWHRPTGGELEDHSAVEQSGLSLGLHMHEPRVLDPGLCADGVSESYLRQLFRGLVELGPEGEVLPDVARRWQVLEGGRRYRFELSQDVIWNDGQPVTAGDFAFAWQQALRPDRHSSAASHLFDIKGARAYHLGQLSDPAALGLRVADDWTLEVELEAPVGYFLQLLTRAAALAVPRHVVERLGEDWSEPQALVVNGPFRLDRWEPGRLVKLVANPAYRGSRSGNVSQVSFTADPEAPLLSLYRAGSLDVVDLNALPMEESERARQQFSDEYVTLPFAQTSYLAFRTTRPPFDDPRVRRAFALATDRPLLANVTTRGAAFPAQGGLTPPGIPGHLADAALSFDPAEARSLLAEAGYPAGQGFPIIDLLAVRRPRSDMLRRHLSQAWAEHLGVTVSWHELWFVDFLESLARDVPAAWISGWAADYPDADNFLRVCLEQVPHGWRHEEFDALIDRARYSADPGQRIGLYHQAERFLAREAPLVPLFYARHHLLIKPRVKHYPILPVGGLSLKDVAVVEGA